MLKLVLALSFVTFLGAPNLCYAYVYDEKVSPDTVTSISVTIDDKAQGGCWTKMGEAKAYAEDKLKLLGYNVIPKTKVHYLRLYVLAGRADNGLCYGKATVQIRGVAKSEGLWGAHDLAGYESIFVNLKNVNIEILDLISTLMKELE